MKHLWLLFFLSSIFCNILFTQSAGTTQYPKHEVRAVWLTTAAGMDWPRTTNVEEQQRSMLDIIQKLKKANFNTIFFQVRARGDAMYKSKFEPWSDRLTGTLGKDPGWDPLSFLLHNAHANGFEVHAWFNTFRVANGIKNSVGDKKHIIESHPDWVKKYNGEIWLDPGIPEVREYNLRVAMDLIRNYDIDGIHFDFIRYPGKDYADEESYRLFGKKKNKDEWRRENVNQFVREIYDSAIAIKPMLKVGSAPIGVYKNLKNAVGWQSYSAIYQDSRRWLEEQKHDYLAPQVYWSLGTKPGDPDFATITKDWSENSKGRHIYIGIGAYKPEVFQQLPLLIDVTRLYGNEGNSFFRYEHIKENLMLGRRYLYPANIPPMKWKDSIPPNPPRDLQVNEISPNTFKLIWKSPLPAVDEDIVKYYNIYRSPVKPVNINDPANILAIIPTDENSYLDIIERPRSGHYYYVVTAFDKGNNESSPASVQEIEITPIVQLPKKLTSKFPLAYLLKKNQKTLYVTYEVEQKGNIILKIQNDQKTNAQIIVDEIKEAGRYIIAVSTLNLSSGSNNIILEAGGFSYSHYVRLD